MGMERRLEAQLAGPFILGVHRMGILPSPDLSAQTAPQSY